MMNFSIVIPTYKRNDDLENCLRSLRKNSEVEHEIIVLYDMNCATKEICDRYGATSLYDKARKNGKRVRGLWAILNDGIRHACNDCVMCLNDDCLVMPGWDIIAEHYFSSNPNLGMLILKTKGIGNDPNFRIIGIPLFPNILCANYAIINRRAGIFFDERFSWYKGDGDISLQFALRNRYAVVGTEEDMIVHNHRIDDSRLMNDSAFFRNGKDAFHYNLKWSGYDEENGHLKKKKLCKRLVIKYKYIYGYITWLLYIARARKKMGSEHREIVVWGSGYRGKVIAGMLRASGIDGFCYVDSSEIKWGLMCNDKSIFSPEYIKNKDVFVIIAVKNAEPEIETQLLSYGKTRRDYLKYSRLFDPRVFGY